MSACNKCQDGHYPVGESFVTHDMALDAGEPSMEGQSMGIEWGACPCCGGFGWEHCATCTEEENTALRAELAELKASKAKLREALQGVQIGVAIPQSILVWIASVLQETADAE